MNVTDTSRPLINTFQGIGLVLAVLGGGATVAGFFVAPETIWQSYLIGFLFWNGVAVASLNVILTVLLSTASTLSIP